MTKSAVRPKPSLRGSFEPNPEAMTTALAWRSVARPPVSNPTRTESSAGSDIRDPAAETVFCAALRGAFGHGGIESRPIQDVGLSGFLLKRERFCRRREEPGRSRFPEHGFPGNREGLQALPAHDPGAAGQLPDPVMLLQDDHPVPQAGQPAGDVTANRARADNYCIVQVPLLNHPNRKDRSRYQL